MYGMEIMKSMGMEIERIHAGHANMFLSPIFRQTLADVSTREAFASLKVLSEIHPGSDSKAVA